MYGSQRSTPAYSPDTTPDTTAGGTVSSAMLTAPPSSRYERKASVRCAREPLSLNSGNFAKATADDTNKDAHLTTTEGGPAYGAVVVSLTTTGDTSPSSALAIDRFDTAPGGNLTYQRGDITVAPEVAAAITTGQAVVVIHGVDYNADGKYDGTVMSDLDPKLPTEATDPALCGVLKAAPVGAMATGAGGASSSQGDEGLLIAGGALLLAAAGTGTYVARRTRTQA